MFSTIAAVKDSIDHLKNGPLTTRPYDKQCKRIRKFLLTETTSLRDFTTELDIIINNPDSPVNLLALCLGAKILLAQQLNNTKAEDIYAKKLYNLSIYIINTYEIINVEDDLVIRNLVESDEFDEELPYNNRTDYCDLYKDLILACVASNRKFLEHDKTVNKPLSNTDVCCPNDISQITTILTGAYFARDSRTTFSLFHPDLLAVVLDKKNLAYLENALQAFGNNSALEQLTITRDILNHPQ
jgi:hypothetical protein